MIWEHCNLNPRASFHWWRGWGTLHSFREWNVSRLVTKLYGWVYEIIKTTPIISSTTVSHQGDYHSAGSQSVAITARSQPEAKFESYEKPIFDYTHAFIHFPIIFPRTIAELLGTISQRPKEMTIRIIFQTHCTYLLVYIFDSILFTLSIFSYDTAPQRNLLLWDSWKYH